MKVMWKSVICLAVAIQFCTVACDDPKLSSWADNVWMVQIVVDPMKNQYEIGDVVTLSYVVLDRYGQTMHWLAQGCVCNAQRLCPCRHCRTRGR